MTSQDATVKRQITLCAQNKTWFSNHPVCSLLATATVLCRFI